MNKPWAGASGNAFEGCLLDRNIKTLVKLYTRVFIVNFLRLAIFFKPNLIYFQT